MAKQLRPSQLEALLSGDLNGNEFFAVHRIGYNYSLTLGELKKYIGTGSSGGGSDIDLTSVPSNIIPDSNGSRILGNAENAWQRLFLTDSIRFINKGIIYGNVDVQGALTLNGQALAMQSSLLHVADNVDKLDARIEKIESGEDVDLSDYYTKSDVDDILKDYTTTSVLQTDYVSVRGGQTITGPITYKEGNLKVGQYAFGAGSSGVTIDGHIIKTSKNSYSNSDIDNMIASVATAGKLGGMLNITDKTAIQNAQKLLTSTNQVAYYIITDSSGKLPSKQSCFDLSADNIKQLSLTSPNALTNAALSLVHGSVAVSPIGVNVGDMIALTRVKVKVADLTATLGVSLSLSGEIEIYQYRILSFNDAKAPNTNGIANGVMGLMTPSDKAEVSKIGGIEWTANHVRDNYLPKADLLPSIWGTNMNDCLSTGVYPWCTLGRPSGSTGAYTCIVKRTSTNDGSYDTIEQTAYGREGELGRVFKRIIFLKTDGTDTQYGEWIELGGDSGSGDNSGIVDGVYNKKLTINSGEDPVVLRLTNNDKGSATKILIQFGDICTLGYNADAGGFQLNGKIVATLNDIPSLKGYAKTEDVIPWDAISTQGAVVTPQSTTNTSGRWYQVVRASNNGDMLLVNVPWTDTDTKYTLPAASSSALGGIKTGYSANNKNYPVQLDANNKAYVNVPWEKGISDLSNYYDKDQIDKIVNDLHDTLTDVVSLAEDNSANITEIQETLENLTIPDMSSFLKDGFSINNGSIASAVITSKLEYKSGTTVYWTLDNVGGGAGNKPRFSKNLRITNGNTEYENVHEGNISSYALTKHQDISGKQDKIDDLSTIRSNASYGLTAYNWGDHSGQGYALKYNFMSFAGVLAADDKSILPYLRTSSPSYGYTSSIANMTIRYCKSSNFNSGYGAFFAFDLTALQTAAMQGNYGSVPIYYAFPNSDYYNDFNNNRTYAVAKSYKLFGNSTELYGNHTAGLYKLIHEGNINNYALTQTTAESTYLKKSGDTINGNLSVSGILTAATITTSKLKIPSTTNNYEFVFEDSNGAIFRPNGTYRAYVGTQNYPFYEMHSYTFSQTSDATKKNILGNTKLTLSQIANAPAVDFTWRNSGEKSVGTIAQYWKSVLPEVVSGEEGSMGMNYATLGVVASIVIARSVETNAQRISRLEMEIENLQKELASLNKFA